MKVRLRVREFLHTHGRTDRQTDAGKIVTVTKSEDVVFLCVCVCVCVRVRTYFCVRHSAGITEKKLLCQVQKAIRAKVHEH